MVMTDGDGDGDGDGEMSRRGSIGSLRLSTISASDISLGWENSTWVVRVMASSMSLLLDEGTVPEPPHLKMIDIIKCDITMREVCVIASPS